MRRMKQEDFLRRLRVNIIGSSIYSLLLFVAPGTGLLTAITTWALRICHLDQARWWRFYVSRQAALEHGYSHNGQPDPQRPAAYGKWLPRTAGISRDPHIKGAFGSLENWPIVADERHLRSRQVLMTTNYRMSIAKSTLILLLLSMICCLHNRSRYQAHRSSRVGLCNSICAGPNHPRPLLIEECILLLVESSRFADQSLTSDSAISST